MFNERLRPKNEITLDQQTAFVSRVRELLGPPSRNEYEEEGRTAIEAVGYYHLGPYEIYVDENRQVEGYPYHLVKLMIISPVEHIDEEHYSRTARTYWIEHEANSTDFEEEREVYVSATGAKVRTPFQEEGIRLTRNEDATAEEFGQHYEAFMRTKELAVAFGYRGFTQNRFHEAMTILARLDPRERLPDPLTVEFN